MAAVLAGAVLRILATRSVPGLDADEAVTGAMAQALLRYHEWPTFYWGQPYGGTLEVGFVAALLAVLPDTALTLRLLPMATSALVPFVVYAIGRRLYRATGAVVAALALWCPVQALAWFQNRQMLFYQPTLLVGTIVLLLSLRFFDRPAMVSAAVIGFLCGLGFWMSTNIVFFAVPAGLVMLAAGWRAWPRLAATVAAGLAGAAPWLLWNLGHGFASLHVGEEYRDGSFGDHLYVYVTRSVPMLVGAASPSGWDLAWGRAGILVAVGLCGALLVAAVAALAQWRPGTPPPVDALGLLTAPFLFAVNPLAGTYVIPRYVLFPFAFFALVAGRLVGTPRSALLALVVAVGLSAGSLARPFQFTGTRSDLSPVEDALAARGVDWVYADYFVTFPLAYRTGEAVVGSPFTANRRPTWDDQVARAPAPAYVFMCNSPDIAVVEAAAAGRGLSVERAEAGGYVVLFPSANLPPRQVVPDRALRDGDPSTQRRCAR